MRRSPADSTNRSLAAFGKLQHIRQNLTMRMSMKRFARLSNGFSKKIENHIHAVAIHYMHYNFARIHKTLRTTPAQAAGVTDRLWEIADIVNLLKQHETQEAA